MKPGRELSTHFTLLPRQDLGPLLFWLGVVVAIGVAANFCALASATI